MKENDIYTYVMWKYSLEIIFSGFKQAEKVDK